MFAYYLNLGLRSLRRNLVLTTLMIMAIAVGIGASMTTLTVFRAMSGDPIPRKSSQLFIPQIDSWGPTKSGPQTDDGLVTQVSYIDAVAWMRAGIGKHQTIQYVTGLAVRPPNVTQKPFNVRTRAAYADFFSLFDVPFQYGGPWSASDDENRAPVVVLKRSMNERLFGGVNSVGKSLRLGGSSYTVVGVIDEWQPIPAYYDLDALEFGEGEEVFLPFTRAIDLHMSPNSTRCKDDVAAGWEARLASNCIWLEYWVELPSAEQAAKFQSFLINYAAEQHRIGRFPWPAKTALRNVAQWLNYRHVVPNEVRILILVSFGFLLVCLLNAMGLMLAKIMSRAGDIGVRRALGASRGAIFAQCLIETGVVGLAGGVLGLALTALGLLAARSLLPEQFAALTYLDAADVMIAVTLSVAATVLAGLYPTWRAAHVQPAWQLKAQ